MFAAYELRYGDEANFEDDMRTRLVFIPQFTISDIQPDITYRIIVRASTVSLTGETLWGPFAELRVLNGQQQQLPIVLCTVQLVSNEYYMLILYTQLGI